MAKAGKLKDNQTNEKIYGKQLKPIENLSFNFGYMTSNKHYGLKCISKKSLKCSEEGLSELISRLEELSAITLSEARRRGKIIGCEPLKYSDFYPNFKDYVKKYYYSK